MWFERVGDEIRHVSYVEYMCPWCMSQYGMGGEIRPYLRNTWVTCFSGCGRTMPLRRVAFQIHFGEGGSFWYHPYSFTDDWPKSGHIFANRR